MFHDVTARTVAAAVWRRLPASSSPNSCRDVLPCVCEFRGCGPPRSPPLLQQRYFVDVFPPWACPCVARLGCTSSRVMLVDVHVIGPQPAAQAALRCPCARGLVPVSCLSSSVCWCGAGRCRCALPPLLLRALQGLQLLGAKGCVRRSVVCPSFDAAASLFSHCCVGRQCARACLPLRCHRGFSPQRGVPELSQGVVPARHEGTGDAGDGAG